MKPLIVLLGAFALTATTSRLTTGSWNLVPGGNVAMFVMLCFTGLAHFKFTEGMTMMMPGFLPFKKELVYTTGVVEILLGVGLLFPQLRFMSGIGLIVLLILMLPANIHAAIRHIDYEKGTFTGSGPLYLWFRVPLQLFFIGWVAYFSLRSHFN